MNPGFTKVEYHGSLYMLVTKPPQAEAPKEKAKKNNRLNEYEGYFLLPCMKKISLSCNARVGSKDKSALSSSIYDGEDYCSYWLTEIRSC